MSQTAWIIVGAVALMGVFDVIVVRLLIRAGWDTLASTFPGRDPAPDAVRREFQSFRFDLYNFGSCVHVAADKGHLHLLPAAIIRWAGGRPMSIPWSAIQPVKCGKRTAVVKIGPVKVNGPAWCLSLADPGAPTPPPS